ncbi:DUF962 domain-containing protein [Oceanicoccus sagamiensis]|uniref:DUF962 family protein n=1 Tax=Oceanicoccus sagamiensis TaxID=716816 RepID=A0A1X9NDT0_9GAMM|nr:DUF962 domain-containing protein [Oceanicoccus sagamiensis]ARN75214.1 hypothetical protein BST96_14470 [Oceanicoccus sagamiensis]
MEKTISSFAEFYPFYLNQHSNRISRVLHYIGTTLSMLLLLFALFKQQWLLLLLVPIAGYSFAWVGHFFFEKNKPATFIYPWYSLRADYVMMFEALTGRLDHSHFSQSVSEQG